MDLPVGSRFGRSDAVADSGILFFSGAPLNMSFLAPLLEAQDLDLAVDAANKRAAELPERGALPVLAEGIVRVEAELAVAREERAEMERSEDELARAVSQIALDIESAEVERYSGKRKDRDEAVAHDVSQQALRDKQTGLEEQEMGLLESIEIVEGRIAEFESTIASHRMESENLAEVIRNVQSEVATKVARLSESRAAIAPGIPDDVLAAYERVRSQPRSGGRGATSLKEGRCTGCRIKLPSLEKKRMLAEPEEALIQCPQCRRVLVRG
ncbi:MAG: hypothetical protein CL933_02795 [Deltaproteobacteria bacterium]|nr:hypothetical protein [Deltaproteobacteria bacterium]